MKSGFGFAAVCPRQTPNSSRTTFSAFTPGTWVNVRARIRVPAGAGDWSNVVQIMMI